MAVATRRQAFPKGEGRWKKVQANALLRAVEVCFIGETSTRSSTASRRTACFASLSNLNNVAETH